VLSLYAQGFRKVLILNGHGGNFVLEPEIRRLNLTHADLIVLMPGESVPVPAGPRILEKAGEVHGGEGATSRQLHTNRQHVKSGRIDFQPAVGREFLDYAFMGYISEWGVWGYPSFGTAEKGARLAEQRVGQIVSWAREAFGRVRALRGGEPG
jgi:creatinine amidohydrolase